MSKKAGKTVTSTIKLVIKAGQAKPAPPVGPALGQAGLNIMSFCKDFNAKTSNLKEDVPVPVFITAYSDKSYTYVTKSPPTSYFIKKALALKSASSRPGHQIVGSISPQQIYEIATIKSADLPHIEMSSLCKTVLATCKSMGVQVS